MLIYGANFVNQPFSKDLDLVQPIAIDERILLNACIVR
jgi:hypothetical protein